MKRFEYTHEYISIFPPSREDDPDGHYRSAKLEVHLNMLGTKGWELVTISQGLIDGEYVDGYAVFKRKLRD